jgi:putative PIN family toxin of toxin-antitoxin system
MRSEAGRDRGVPRLVVDTNLLVGWLFRPAARGPRRLVECWKRGEVRLCVSAAVVGEIRGTFSHLPVDEARKREILDRLDDPELTDHLDPIPDSGFRCADPDDDKFLHLAAAARADALITSDRALLEVEEFPVPIVKSGQWLRSRDRSEE